MDTRVVARPARTTAVVVLMAVAFDVLVFQHPLGIGLGVAGSLFAAVVWFGERTLSIRPTSSARLLALVLAVVAWIPTFRAAPTLTALAVIAIVGLGMVSIRVLARDDLRAWTVGRYAGALGRATLAAVVETFDFVTEDVTFGHTGNRVGRILIGLLVVLPVLIVFTALFAGADAVFSRLLDDVVNIDLGRFVTHVLTVAALTWAGLGMLRHALRVETPAPRTNPRPRLVVEATAGLVAIAALFAVFVVIQFAYLFGGLDTNTGLTYAEYARRGFFQLVTVGALVVLLALAVDRLVQGVERSRIVDGLLTVLVAETLLVLAGAVVRLRLYVDAYGLTDARFYAAVFLLWAGLVLVLVVVMLLRGRRSAFALTAFATGIVLLIGTAAVNPDGVIARTNLTKDPVDVGYLSSLSADAVPSLIGHIDPWTLCGMVEAPGDWRSFTFAEAGGRRALDKAGAPCES
ncbi:MAG: DUF4173 domain-containing protein [Actinobacteria bacterium]|nr:DUF4173 domain-containing protein [Actinomycetota bacterium]